MQSVLSNSARLECRNNNRSKVYLVFPCNKVCLLNPRLLQNLKKKINENEIFENSMVTENRVVKTAEKMKSIKNQN